MIDASWYVKGSDIHRDLGVDTIKQTTTRQAKNHEKRLHHECQGSPAAGFHEPNKTPQQD